MGKIIRVDERTNQVRIMFSTGEKVFVQEAFEYGKLELIWWIIKASRFFDLLFFFGGDKGSRTPDLLNAIQALYQLSYAPERV